MFVLLLVALASAKWVVCPMQNGFRAEQTRRCRSTYDDQSVNCEIEGQIALYFTYTKRGCDGDIIQWGFPMLMCYEMDDKPEHVAFDMICSKKGKTDCSERDEIDTRTLYYPKAQCYPVGNSSFHYSVDEKTNSMVQLTYNDTTCTTLIGNTSRKCNQCYYSEDLNATMWFQCGAASVAVVLLLAVLCLMF